MLNDEQRMKLEDDVCRKTGLDVPDVDWMSDQQLLDLLSPEPVVAKQPKESKKPGRRYKVKNTYLLIRPETIRQAFAVVDGVLHRRKMYQQAETGQLDEQLIRCDSTRVQFQGILYSSSLLVHYLQTGEWLARTPREKKPHQAQIRHNGRVISLGYFATREECEAAKTFFRQCVKST